MVELHFIIIDLCMSDIKELSTKSEIISLYAPNKSPVNICTLMSNRMQCLLCLGSIQCLLAEGTWGNFPIGLECPKSAAATGEAA